MPQRVFFDQQGVVVHWRQTEFGVYHATRTADGIEPICGASTKLLHDIPFPCEGDPGNSIMTCQNCVSKLRCRRATPLSNFERKLRIERAIKRARLIEFTGTDQE